MKAYQIESCKVFGAQICVAKKDVRYYLEGVFISPARGTAAATDGHKLLVGYLDTKQPEFPDVIIPDQAITNLGKLAGKKLRESSQPVFLRLYDREETPNAPHTLRMDLGDAEIWTTPIDGKFPDYERMIPSAVSGELGQFDAELLVQCQRALRLYASGLTVNPFLQHNGTSAGVMSSDATDAIVIIMPWRCDKPNAQFAPKLAEPVKCAA
jgi:hypothetical protein